MPLVFPVESLLFHIQCSLVFLNLFASRFGGSTRKDISIAHDVKHEQAGHMSQRAVRMASPEPKHFRAIMLSLALSGFPVKPYSLESK